MATTLVTITGDVTDLIGGDFDARRTKVYLKHNTSFVVDPDAGVVRLGSATLSIDIDGTFTLPDVIASADTVENLQSTIYVDYEDRASRKRQTQSFGPYDLSGETGTVDLTDLEEVQHLDPSYVSVTMTEMQGLLDQAAEYLAEQIDLSNISTPDALVATLVENTGGAGPLTSAALTASYVAQISPLTAAQGGTDIAADIAAAFADGAHEVRVAGTNTSYYPVATTIDVPTGKVLRIPAGTDLRPTSDINVIQVREGATIEVGTVTVSGLTFTKAAFRGEGTTTWGSSGQPKTRVRGRVVGKTGGGGEGYGLHLTAGDVASRAIMWADIDLHITGTDGTLIQATNPSSGASWINGNRFNIIHDRAKRGLRMLADTNAHVDGNQFPTLTYQRATGCESALYCEGRYNEFPACFVWDWPADTTAITFANRSSQNVISTNVDGLRQMVDYGWANEVHTHVGGSTGRRPTRSLGAPGGTANPARYGDQDDWLAFAATRGDVTVASTGTAPSAGAVVNVFDPDITNTVTYNDSGTHTVEATWASTMIGRVYGVVFQSGTRLPSTVKCEVRISGVWQEILNVTDNRALTLEVSPTPPNDSGHTGVRWTFTGFGPTNTTNTILVERLWMFDLRKPGQLYAYKTALGTNARKSSGATTRNNDATLADDPDLTRPVAASTVYKWRAVLHYSSSAVAGLKVGFTAPSGASVTWGVVGGESVATAAGPTTLAGAGAGVRRCAVIEGIIVVSATAGNLTMQWAQGTAEASNTILYAHSTLEITKAS